MKSEIWCAEKALSFRYCSLKYPMGEACRTDILNPDFIDGGGGGGGSRATPTYTMKQGFFLWLISYLYLYYKAM